MSDHNQDEYLDPSEYLKHAADDSGFSTFELDGSFYFSKQDGDRVVFMSQGYTSEAGRNNGVESVKKNMALDERYQLQQYEDKWYISLKAGNRQEIAVSPLYNDKASALALMPGGASAGASSSASAGGSVAGSGAASGAGSGTASSGISGAPIAAAAGAGAALVGFLGKMDIGESSSSITKVDSTKTKYHGDDRYLSMSKYNDNLANKSTVDGDFIQFSEGGKFYFGLLDSDGKMAMRSDGYGSAADRDGAIKAASAGKYNGANYSILETREGKYFVLLRDGAHNEIGRSAAFSSRAQAVSFVPETRVVMQTISSSSKTTEFGGLAAKASAALAAAGSSSFVAAAGGPVATATATAFKAAPVIAPVAAKAAATAGWGLVPWAAGLFLLPLLFLLKPAPTLVPLKPALVTFTAPPPPVIPPPIPPPAAKVQLIGPKVGPKVSGF